MHSSKLLFLMFSMLSTLSFSKGNQDRPNYNFEVTSSEADYDKAEKTLHLTVEASLDRPFSELKIIFDPANWSGECS